FPFTATADADVTSDPLYVSVRENYLTTGLQFMVDGLFSDDATGMTGIPLRPRTTLVGNNDTANWLDTKNLLTPVLQSGYTASPWAGTGVYSDPYALSFDGDSDYILANYTTINPASITQEVWAMADVSCDTGQYGILLGQSHTSTHIEMLWRFGMFYYCDTPSGHVKTRYSNATETDFITSAANSVPKNEWWLMNSSYNGTTANLYKNVSQLGTKAMNITPSASDRPISIGNLGTDSPDPVQYFKGKIAREAIYSSALTTTQLKDNFNAIANRFRVKPVEHIVKSNLVLHFDAANANQGLRPYSNGCAATDLSFFDLSTSSLPATLTNFASCDVSSDGWRGDGSVGSPYLLNYDGENDYASVAYNSVHATTADFSVEVFVRCPTADGVRYFLGRYSGADKGWILGVNNTSSKFNWRHDGSLYQVNGGTVCGNANWKHIVATRSGSRYSIYVNGVLGGIEDSGIIGDINYTGSATYIGSVGFSPMLGDLAIARLYTKALTYEEVIQNCLAEESRFTATPNAICSSKYLIPTITSGSLTDASSPAANGSSFQVTITFNQAVTNFNPTTELTVTGGSIASCSGSGTTYNCTINTTAGTHDVTVSVAASVASANGYDNSYSAVVFKANRPPTLSSDTNDQIFPIDGTDEPLVQGSAKGITITASDPDSDALQTMTCTYQTVGLSSSDPNYIGFPVDCNALDSYATDNSVSLLSKATFGYDSITSQGYLYWIPTLDQRGTYKFTFSISDGYIVSTKDVYVTVRENYLSTNIKVANDAIYSTDYTGFSGVPLRPRLDNSSDDVTSTDWFDMKNANSNYDAVLSQFISANPWSGNGIYTTPYALTFNGNGDYADLGSPLNDIPATRMLFNTWIKPSDVTSAAQGKIILADGTASGNGFVLAQAKANAAKAELMIGTKNYASVVAATGGLVGYWRFNETSGSVAYDSSGANVCSGSPCDATMNTSYVEVGKEGALANDSNYSMKFNSTNDNIYVPYNAALNPSTFTIEAWAYWDGTNSGDWGSVVTSRNANTVWKGYMIYRSLTTNVWRFYWGDDTAWRTAVSASAATPNKWTHIVATHDGSVGKLYLDGVMVDSATFSFVPNNVNQMNIGAGSDAGTHYPFTGGIDEVAFYNTALDATTIANHYKAGVGCRSTTSMLNGRWYHVGGVYDGTNTKLVINGQTECSIANDNALANGTTNLRIGGSGAGTYFNGQMSQLQVYGTSGAAIGDANTSWNNFINTINRFRGLAAENIVTSNLVLYLDPANAKEGMSFPGTSSNATCADMYTNFFDLSKSGINGTLSGFSGCDAGVVGWRGTGATSSPYKLVFDGTDDKINLGTSATIQPANLTFMGWFKRTKSWANNETNLLYAKGAYDGNGFYTTFGPSNGTYAFYFVADGFNGFRISTAVDTFFPINEWTHIAFTFNSTDHTARFYKNGVSQTFTQFGTPLTVTSTTDTKYIGYSTYNNLYNDEMGPVMLYSSDLTATQIRQNYLAQAPRFRATTLERVSRDGLVYEFDAANAAAGTKFPGVAAANCSDLFTSPIDLSPYAHTLTLTNFTTNCDTYAWQGTGTTSSPYAIKMDGSSNYITTADNAALDGTGMTEVTTEGWVKFDSTASSFNSLLAKQNDSSEYSYSLYLATNTNPKFALKNQDGTAYLLTTTTNVITGTWYYMAGTWDGTTARIFLNGAELNNMSATGTSVYDNASTLKLGFDGMAGHYLTGSIMKARVLNRALYANELKQNFLTEGNRVRSQSLTPYYPKYDPTLVLFLDAGNAKWGVAPGDQSDCDAHTFYDLSMNGNHGTLTNFPTAACTAGTSGWDGTGGASTPYVLNFDGTDDYVTLGDPASGIFDFARTDSFTLSAWFKTTNSSASSRIISKGFSAATIGYMLGLNTTGTIRFGMGAANSVSYVTYSATTNTYNDGNWHQVIFTHDGTSQREKVYVDGQLQNITSGYCGTVVSSNQLDISACTKLEGRSTSNLTIGTKVTYSEIFNGSMQFIRIYKRALPAEEVEALYNSEDPYFP
ncbi:MAG: hypothetical protein HQK53_08140, partial [Oligoflexia bacterium]|nr:hypothetical protein [Oligoflexia bacterium]